MDALAHAVALADPPAEMVEIPFEGATLPGVFARARGAAAGERRPTIVYTNGYDSTIAEMWVAHVPAAVERGYHMLLYDGPGQGRNVIRDGLTLRPDWEAVVTPVIDFALARTDVDPDEIVLAGWSLGGFLAPRAAGREARIAALVADPGQWDQKWSFLPRLPLSDEEKAAFPDGVDPSRLDAMEQSLAGPGVDPTLRWRLVDRAQMVHGTSTLFEYFAEMARFEVSSVAGGIRCPTLLTTADDDPISAGASMLLDAIGSERKTLIRFTAAEGAGGHCEGTARRLYHQRVYDWLDETLAAA
jgi:pimeloyl-ACP methyl ester carboxylesterase